MPAPHPQRRRSRKGIALATTLIFLMVLFIGATALGTISINNLTLRKISSNSVVAMQAAEAGLAMVQAKLNATPSFGRNGESLSGTLSASGATWTVQFTQSGSPGATDSVNNLTSKDKVTRQDGTQVPPYSIDVIVSTNVASPNRNIPKVGCVMSNLWTNAVATTGTIDASGGMMVYGASSLAVAKLIAQNPSNGAALEDLPGGGKLAANSAANPSVIMGNGSYYDSLTTMGTTQVPSTLPVAIQNTVPVPNFTWSFYTPNVSASNVGKINANQLAAQIGKAGGKDTFYLVGDINMSNLTINNATLCVNGNATFSGALSLINSTLYVNGNLVINGGIKDQNSSDASCTGSIYVCGAGHTTTINGSSSMVTYPITGSGSTYDKPSVAIFSQGDIHMNGQQSLAGVIYSDGNISVNGGTCLIGLAIANGTAATEIDTNGTFIYCTPYAQAFSTQIQLKMNKLSWRIIDNL